MKVKRRIEFKSNMFLNIVLGSICLLCFLVFLFVPKIYLKGNSIITVNINSKYYDEGIEAHFISKNEKNKIKVVSNVNTSKKGTYEVKYIYKNSLYTYEIKRTVIVEDLQAPSIVLNGNKTEYYCPNGKYEEVGYKAYDNVDGNITDLVKITKNKDEIIYEVKDSSNNKSVVTRKLKKKDNEKPNITLNGSNTVFVSLNESYMEDGAVALDNCDLDISNNIVITNNIDISKVGDYEVKYIVKDSSNNKSLVIREVKVRKLLDPNTIYLTFDDGPREGTTDVILDVLKEKGVKATFFVTNNGSDELIKRIVNEGHSIGIHTASHRYDVIYASVDNYFNDLELVKQRIYNLTGINTNLIRFPGGSSNTISKKYSEGIMSILTSEVLKRGYQYYDWNIESGDSSFATNKIKLYNSVTSKLSHDKYNVILMHDTKTYTRDSLAEIIDYDYSNGYNFSAISSSDILVRQKVNN